MNKYIQRLEQSLNNILQFWLKNNLKDNTLYQDISIDGKPVHGLPKSSMFYARVMYGASAGCNYFNTTRYNPLADKAFEILYNDFKNPGGGFF